MQQYLDELATKGKVTLALHDISMNAIAVAAPGSASPSSEQPNGGTEASASPAPSSSAAAAAETNSKTLATSYARALDTGKRMDMGRVRRIMVHTTSANSHEQDCDVIQTTAYDGPSFITTTVAGTDIANVMYASQQLDDLAHQILDTNTPPSTNNIPPA